ncbi:hypothetical protein J2Z64_000098 [Oceanobacillus polygoni]|uniref:Uncharacterized protein n=1 Tax=Oceanobacillus polygoni TaxID=1235259 RepID=A0A9X0YNH4_9BACI|nr:hypothetical protein [Oceanobacillus polygoni]
MKKFKFICNIGCCFVVLGEIVAEGANGNTDKA